MSELSNYRTISHLSLLSRLTERVVKLRLVDFISANNLLNSFQSAYIRHHSTEQRYSLFMIISSKLWDSRWHSRAWHRLSSFRGSVKCVAISKLWVTTVEDCEYTVTILRMKLRIGHRGFQPALVKIFTVLYQAVTFLTHFLTYMLLLILKIILFFLNVLHPSLELLILLSLWSNRFY